ncbi:TPA: hypothetical protein HA242_04280 [Candidatus Woesearchaeota archaeon]|nr:hypothetical protein [Candidatus Woesearchaeota archaeon]HIH12916.1 hypothetical protein [Candidatus Woesearchaeota archaeon]
MDNDDDRKNLEATITSLILEGKYIPTQKFIGWWHQRQMRKGKKHYMGICYEEVTSSWRNFLQPDDLWQYNHTEYCVGELEYSIAKAGNSQQPWKLSIFGRERVEDLVSFANKLGEECKVSIDVAVARKYPKTWTWKEYRKDKEEYVELDG